ncbi:hypothetical protein CTI12_AA143690 [Artemisia annua]|uniref:Uncharacterized protein n=1 Tax=Artemisia annua TaxID=35608 RepID=A0A2U1PK64_ARTAN|nr:hypothetical protein CTI12_AA143690 [Artemisia annua]
MNGGGNSRAAEKEQEENRKVFWGLMIKKGMIVILSFVTSVVGFSFTSYETMTAVAITAAFSIFLYFTANFFRVGYRAHSVCTAFGVASKGVLCTYLIKRIIWPNHEFTNYIPEAFVGVAMLVCFALFYSRSVKNFFREVNC